MQYVWLLMIALGVSTPPMPVGQFESLNRCEEAASNMYIKRYTGYGNYPWQKYNETNYNYITSICIPSSIIINKGVK